ncbi:hypothetical protein PS467_27275 [Streptomyces luomodiensis]|uniref:Carboxylesterase type B domain-containing protein n=1 Tax=Streptomyces luomodiensis TaxID=3026192 RepID=A0ABY9V1W7_9ACTN|nr:hypothetical protein [Streptomyces sp. SCA4-21]WNE98773.1 hypothetical protein PS467_27275 [Streptomyces sp. SCA4-21]
METVSGPGGWLGTNPPQDLADRVHGIWLRFATDGTVPWPRFDPTTRIVHRLAQGRSASEAPLPAAAFVPPPAAHLPAAPSATNVS